jgi:opacity protein-like surface antigen
LGRRFVFNVAALVAFLLLSPEVWASDLFSPVPIAAQKAERFNGWFVGGFWANPLATFHADHGTSPLSSAKLTGSLVGLAGGRGFQRGMFYYGFSGSLAGGVFEGQSDGASCPANCYTSLNVLVEATLSVGLVFWDRLLVRLGGGPNFALMRSGQTLYGINNQFVSGVHATMGLEYALTDHWSVFGEGQRVRVGDLYYNTPSGHIGVNPHDFWMGTAGVNYRF